MSDLGSNSICGPGSVQADGPMFWSSRTKRCKSGDSAASAGGRAETSRADGVHIGGGAVFVWPKAVGNKSSAIIEVTKVGIPMAGGAHASRMAPHFRNRLDWVNVVFSCRVARENSCTK